MNILATIIAEKKKEVAIRKTAMPMLLLEHSTLFEREPISMKGTISAAQSTGIIAEFKRKSPSKSWINQSAEAGAVSLAYARAGVAGISVLTDAAFFGAQHTDFEQVRTLNQRPVLRKDFIIDEYQIIESKAMGADVILLLAKVLPPEKIEAYTALAHRLGLEVLLEMQNEQEVLANCTTAADMLGINNRNLENFSVDFENSARLAALLPQEKLKIAESGIETAQDIRYLRSVGFSGFLIGDRFMRHDDPGLACTTLIKHLGHEH
ncbi:MAG: hypothetical protein BGO31_01805 [Bacteroidetes bacterium 43-16]|nr:MAG: hypothetical protein BGO31_01805 [Bacteroidetes bacterium 43-16]